MWTIDDQCYPKELGPEVLAQVQRCLAEYVRTGDEGLIGEGRKRVGRRAGRGSRQPRPTP